MSAKLRIALRAVLSGAVLWAAGPGHAGSHSATSNITTVDTRATAISVAGRVLDAVGRAPLAGVTVTLAGQTTATGSDGSYSFAVVSLPAGATLTASRAGYRSQTVTVKSPAGARAVTVKDILLARATTTKPTVTSVRGKYEGIFLGGVSFENEYEATVDWGGGQPGYVRFLANGRVLRDVTGTGPEYASSVDIGSAFRPSFSGTANRLTVQAVSASGQASEPVEVYVTVIPLPDALQYVSLGDGPLTVFLNGHIALDFDFPKPPIKAVLDLPLIGKFGCEVAANASFDYTVTDGEWEAAFGVGAEGKQGKRGRRPTIPGLTRYPKLKLYVGNKEISGEIDAGARGTATVYRGITFDEVFGHGAIEARLELGRVGLLDLFGPGLSSAVGRIPYLGDVVKIVSVIIYVIPGLDGELVIALHPDFHFESLEIAGKVGLDTAYEPNLGVAKMRLYLGGEPSVTFGIPGELFRKLQFRVYAGVEFSSWIFQFGPYEHVFVDVSIPSVQSLAAFVVPGSSRRVVLLRAVGPNYGILQPLPRQYLLAGGERFMWFQPESSRSLKSSVSDHFRRLSGTRPRGAVMTELVGRDKVAQHGALGTPPTNGRDTGGSVGAASGGAVPSQADLTLVANSFPNSQPALGSRGTELMLLYVADNGSSNALQFTDIKWTRWDRTNWSVPQTIETNTQAEFGPQLAYDGNGDAIAVWERVADPNFNQTNLTAMASEMEIVWAKWSRETGTWSKPLALTTNDYLDHAPLLCGPMADGSVLTVWTRNYANQLMGAGPVGAVENDQVMWSKWNPVAQSWSQPLTLVSNLPYRLSQSLSGVSNRAVYVWTRDLDGILTNAFDQQVFYCQWQDGAWGPVTQFTTDTSGNRNTRVSVSPLGQVYLVWQQGTNLVLSTNFSASVSPVRADSQTAGFADYAMTAGSQGNLVLLWQEMSQAGSDAHYMVYDPASGTWSRDMLLCNDPALERSFAPVWDNLDNLTVAYNKVEILRTNKTLTLEDGQTVTITNVPQPGRVDLVVTKRALVRDLALLSGDLSVSGDNYLPGDPLTLSATVRNIGDVAVSNVVVSFFDGDPKAGGSLITNVAVSALLEGGATAPVEARWIMPEPAAPHTLYAIVDHAGAVTEYSEENNSQHVRVGGTDLAVSVKSSQAERDGSVRIIAVVQNLGAPAAPASVVAVRLEGQTNAPLAVVSVPELEPGRLAEVALDLPAGTQPEGERLYRLFADETRATADVDLRNNTVAFAVNLWVDTDGDGMPDGWEQTHGLASDNPADASADPDQDGLSNLAEYLAGTDPRDGHSYLWISSIGVAEQPAGIELRWGSVPNRLYTVLRSESVPADFVPIVEHVLSTPPENVWVDSTATNSATYFYRIKVE